MSFQVRVDSCFVRSYEPGFAVVKPGQAHSDSLRLAPNLDPSIVEPSLLELQHISDLRETRDSCVGKSVMITGGIWKSYIGTIKTTGGPGQFLVQLYLPLRKVLIRYQDLALIQ